MQKKGLRSRDNIRDNVFLGVFVLGVIFIRIFYITRTTGPFIYADEFGYWSHAAHLTGNIWAGVMDGMGWYSFGYSFWLALTFLLSDNMVAMFRAAILLNVMMSLAIYGLAYGTVKRILTQKKIIVCGAIAFVATSFPTYIFYSYTTLAETLIALLVWLLFYELMLLEEKPVWWKGILLGLTSGYAYMVHNRMLTAVLAVGVCMILLWARHRVDWKIIASFVLSIIAMLLVYLVLKAYLEGMIVSNQAITDTGIVVGRGNANTFSRIMDVFFKTFSAENILKPFINIIGQLWQCLSATYLLIGIGLVYCVCHFKGMIAGGRICLYSYPFLAFLFSVGLTGVVAQGSLMQVGDRVRLDPAFYGRYNECYFPLLVMMALILLWEGRIRDVFKISICVLAVYICLAAGMYFRLNGIENGYLNVVSAVSIHVFYWLGEFSVWKCFMIVIPVSIVVIITCSLQKLRPIGYYCGLCLILALFCMTALHCMRSSIRGENDYTLQFAPIYDYLNENTEEKEIVYICDENKAAYDLQSRLVDQVVVSTIPEKVAEVEEGCYLVVPVEQMKELKGILYEICMECQGYVVLRLV